MLQTNASVVNLLFHVTQYVASLATESCSIRSQSPLHLSYIHTWTLLWSRSIWPQSNLPKWNLMPAMYGGTAIAQLHLRSVVLPQGRGARGGMRWGKWCLPFDLIHNIQGQEQCLSAQCVHSIELLCRAICLRGCCSPIQLSVLFFFLSSVGMWSG